MRLVRVALATTLTVALAASAAGCGGGGAPTVSRAEAAGRAGTVAAALHKKLDDRVAQLEVALESCDRVASDAAWKKARIAWAEARVFPMEVGTNRRLGPAIDFWHNGPYVITILQGTDPVDVEAVALLGAPFRGLPAVETALAFEPWGERACAFALSATVGVRRATAPVAADWAKLGSRFGDEPRALADLVSGLAEAISLMHGTALAVPSGIRTGTPPDPSMVPGGLALEEARATLASLARVMRVSVSPLLPEVTRTRFDDALTAARRSLDVVPAPLTAAVVNETEAVRAASELVKQIEILLVTEVAGQLGLTLSFSSTDGD